MAQGKFSQPDEANLSLWNQVRTPDPEYCRKVKVKHEFTTIDPQYQLQEATKLWGTYGRKWGLRDLQYGQIIEQSVDATGKFPITKTTVTLLAEFYYPSPDNGEEVSFPIAADMAFRAHDDTYKKLLTNCRSKALSFLGFGADVFMGKWDDAAYVREAEIKHGDQETFRQQALVGIKKSKTKEALEQCRARVDNLFAEETIPATLAAELYTAIATKRTELEHATA